MSVSYPDLNWYTAISKYEGVSPRCPFANVHRCPRYYSTLYLVGDAGVTTRMKPEKIRELDTLWDRTDVLPVVAEHDTSITSYGGKKSTYSNFCPEISYDVFGLLAHYLHSYPDETDRDLAHDRLKHEANSQDWRWQWENVALLHYLDCPVYSQLLGRDTSPSHAKPKADTNGEMVEIKPGIGGVTLNVKVLLTRIAKWWLSRKGNLSGI